MAVSSSPRTENVGTQPSGVTKPTADPVAGILDWLGRYDFREVAVDAASSSGKRSVVAHDVQRDVANTPQAHLMPFEEDVSDEMASAEMAQIPKQGSIRQRAHEKSGPPPPPETAVRPPSLAQSAQRPSRGSENGKASAWSRCRPAVVCVPEIGEDTPNQEHFQDEEEVEWDARQRKSGTVGRLAVYHAGDNPREDVVLRGGGRKHIVVAGVREGGQAARVGVRAGDRLVSIDGKKDFLGMSADAVSEALIAPTVLVFLGFVGKLQAEVRLTCGDNICGLSARHDIARGSIDAPVTLCEQRVFNAGIASLFLTVNASEEAASVDGVRSVLSTQLPLFELQHKEASSLVKRALKRLEAKEVLAKDGSSNLDSNGATASSFPKSAVQFPHGNSPVSQLKLDFMEAALPDLLSPGTPVQKGPVDFVSNPGSVNARAMTRPSPSPVQSTPSPAQTSKDAHAIDPYFV